MPDFSKLKSPAEVRALLRGFGPLATESVPVAQAHGRVLAEDFVAAAAQPEFTRSTMDGFAVRAADVAGATASAPRRLTLVEAEPLELEAGQAAPINTGGAVPEGADAVVMIERTRPAGQALEVLAAVGRQKT